jgi:hypothetical protein
MEELINQGVDVQVLEKSGYAEILLIRDQHTGSVLVSASAEYIPMAEFKSLFERAGELVKLHKVAKLIFDKRSLSVFHQPSMEWYFVHWKEQMIDHGLTTHVKLLPADSAFRESVRIGRDKIEATYPQGRFRQLDIFYAESLLEAVTYGR